MLRFFFAVLVMSVISAVPMFAQNKAVAKKFDEFQGRPFGDAKGLYEKTWRFLEELIEAPKETRGVIIVHREYKISCDGSPYVDDMSAENLIRQLSALFPELDGGKLKIVRGVHTIGNRVFFWLVPSGAVDPTPTDFISDFGCCCATFSIIGREVVKPGTEILRYSYNSSHPVRRKLNWRVSSGKIIAGQGSEIITVQVDKTIKELVVSLLLDDINPACQCPVSFEFTTQFKEIKK